MNIFPEDTADAAALREELREKRGGVHLEVGRFVPSEPSRTSAADALAGELGFTAPPEWTALAPAEALAFLVRLLSCPPAHDAVRISRAEAEALAARVGALFSERARFFMNSGGELAPPPDEGAKPPTVDSILDSSLFIVDGDRAGLLWVESED